METISLDHLQILVEKGRELQQMLHDSPEIMDYMKLAQQQGNIVMPIRADCLVEAKQAAQILGVGKNTIYQFIKEGLIRPFYTPNSSHMKFWISDVRKLARSKAPVSGVS